MTAPTASAADLVVSGIGTALPPPDGDGGEEWFDYRTELGPRGYKYVPRATQLLLAAAKRALAEARWTPEGGSAEDCGVALASNNCASRLHATIDRTVLTRGVEVLRPATVPFFSVNLFLSRLAIEHGLRGFSLALHSPRIAGLEAIEAGARAVRLGRARWLVLGVTEDPLDEAEPRSADSEDGAAVLIAEPVKRAEARQAHVYGRCAVRSLFLPPSALTSDGAAARRLVLAALRAVGAGAPAEMPVRLVGDDSPVSDAVAAALGARTERRHAGPGALAPLLEVTSELRAGAGRERVIATAAATGNVAIARVTATA
ncbi:beta-ketoacyl synthase N-terminal-like domain-containing protein [Streptomyces gobiensis]|uniref:beta-ketoacyl synthase N-terminal-like domain-containing protein n=1 Tax=Streptomyces gobiensis TaxID=2875706 RepID=UPI001E42EC66|nr:beta-ketoacyl synthase N-terminal-like domain-containing protein [Streptomyces gobiensis]UGY94203.1 3-oxoacyl-ACP synthase [Streptomyces gobiensis]